MKKFKQSYPRRRTMLATPFVPLSDDDFRELVTLGSAIPGQQGSALFVAKWRDGRGMDADAFLLALRAQGSKLVVRKFKQDVNIRVVRSEAARAGGMRSSPPSPKPVS
ncbi:MAG TPA: hypothetical protein VK424_06790 [Thermoplasmata archaeon]|nr:hypothetical protein [Thermoplasmata archaeon]